MRRISRTLTIGLLLAAAACGGGSKRGLDRASRKKTTTVPTGVVAPVSEAQGSSGGSTKSVASMHLASPAFADGAAIPAQFTCAGSNQSVPLTWSGVPAGTASLALRMQDTDTPQKYIHWLVYAIKPATTSASAGQAPPGATQVKNSFGQASYAGPCPQPGPRHRYVFTLLALGTTPGLPSTQVAADAWSALEHSNVLARGELTGTFARAGPTRTTKKE